MMYRIKSFFKKLLIVIIVLAVLVIANSCWYRHTEKEFRKNNGLLYASDFDKEWIMGKTPEEIVAKYGEFDIDKLQDCDVVVVASGRTNAKKIFKQVRQVRH